MSVEEARVRFAPPITASELLGRRLQDGKELALTNSPIHMFKAERPGSASSEYGGIIPYQLDGYGFWRFLNTIAPIPYATDVQGTLDDWRMPEMVYQSKLLERHQRSLGENWDIFEKSRQIFMETMMFDPRLQGMRTAEKFRQLLNMSHHALAPFAKSMIDPASPRELQQAFITFLKHRSGFRDRKWLQQAESADVTRERVFQSDYWRIVETAQSFLVAALGGNDLFIKELIVEKCNNTFDPPAKALEIVDGNVVAKVGTLLRGEVAFTPHQNGNRLWELRPETVVSANYLVPTIHWIKEAGDKRRWVLDFLEEPFVQHCQQFMDRLPDDLLFDPRRLNPLIGLATIPYFIPSLRADWPRYQGIQHGEVLPAENGKEGNFMGPGAVLVLALQRKDTSLQSEYFDAAEAHIEKYAA